MASPVVEATAEGAVTTAGTAHTITYPTGAAAGDLIIVFFTCSLVQATITMAESFTKATQNISGNHSAAIFYKEIDGTEGGSTDITTGGNTRSAWTVYRISGHEDPATQAPEFGSANEAWATATSTTPDPPSVSPTGGSKDYLFIAGFRQAGEEVDDDTWCSAAPTNYGTLLQKTNGVAGTPGNNCSVATAHRAATTATEDPSTFTVAQSLLYHAQTIAIHPASAPAATRVNVIVAGL